MTLLNSFDNTRIFYEYKKGEKETLVFIHGWCTNHSIWKHQVAYLQKKGFGTLVIDLRGHGYSDFPIEKEKYKLLNFAKDIERVIKSLQLTQVTYIGHSLGGMIGLRLYRHNKKLISKLILLDTSFENPLKSHFFTKKYSISTVLKEIMSQLDSIESETTFYDFSKDRFRFDTSIWLKGSTSTADHVVRYCFEEMLLYNEKKLLHKINIPTLLIVGKDDKLTPKEIMTQMKNNLPNSELKILAHVSHNASILAPRKVNNAIYNFIKD